MQTPEFPPIPPDQRILFFGRDSGVQQKGRGMEMGSHLLEGKAN